MVWPAGWVDEERLNAWIAERSDGADPTTLAARRDDLYLACACAAGNEDAIRAFEGRHFVEVDRALARMRQVDISADEVRQRLREKLPT